MLKLLDLFSGIGGFSLGLERTGGFETVAFCEIEDFPRKVLAKLWPEVPCYDDIRTLDAGTLQRDGIEIDAICGGFPCQDISTAGKGAGIEGERSGLWTEYARLIGELRPRVVFVENVAALLGRGLDKVLGDLAALGYDAEWHCIPASAVGAPHRRDRLWIIAHAHSQQHEGCSIALGRVPANGLHQETLGNTKGKRCGEARQPSSRSSQRPAGSSSEPIDVANTDITQCTRLPRRTAKEVSKPCFDGEAVSHSASIRCRQVVTSKPGGAPSQETTGQIMHGCFARGWKGWEPEPSVGRVADGVPSRTHRLRALGNAVVPQIPELLGNAYLASLEAAA